MTWPTRIEHYYRVRYILDQIYSERERAARKHGRQHDRPVVGFDAWVRFGEVMETSARVATDSGGLIKCTWADIFMEEVGEALQERDPERLRAELVQVGAMAVAWIEAIDAQVGPPPHEGLREVRR